MKNHNALAVISICTSPILRENERLFFFIGYLSSFFWELPSSEYILCFFEMALVAGFVIHAL